MSNSDTDPSSFVAGKYLPIGSLHPRLEEKARPPYVIGDYDNAVFVAMKCVEVAVRRTAELGDEEYGVSLMRKAFNPEDESSLSRRLKVKSEREAMAHLFAGAIGLLKNPSSHREVNLGDPIEVADILRFADLLLRIVDRSRTDDD